MPIGSLKNANSRANAQSIQIVTPKGRWLDINDNIDNWDAFDYSNPTLTDENGFHLVQVPVNVSKVLIRIKTDKNNTSFSTYTLRLFGVNVDAGSIDGFGVTDPEYSGPPCSFKVQKLNVGTWVATDLSFTINSSTSLRDANYYYSDMASISGYNVLGYDYIGVLSTTFTPTGDYPTIVQCLFL